VPIPPDLREPGGDGSQMGKAINCYEGVSQFRDTSDAESLHEAIQVAAAAAVADKGLGPGDMVDFEIHRIQIRVSGNPNVKVYRVELSDAG
jgi:hypothetical protein